MKDLSEKEAAGMTVNERLFHADLLHDFDVALTLKDEVQLKSILEKIYINPDNIPSIIKQLLDN